MDTGFDPAWIDALEPAEVYKHDARSRVWRIDAPDGRSFVIKRFEFNPIRQALGRLLGMHPGQRERRRCRQLQQRGLAVVPIFASGIQRAGYGLNLWLATPYVGISLHHLFYHGRLTDPDQRERVLCSVGQLTSDLIRRHLYNRDHKASNILIDQDDRAWLIDVGAVRLTCGSSGELAMVHKLGETLAQAGADQQDQVRLFESTEFRLFDPACMSPRP